MKTLKSVLADALPDAGLLGGEYGLDRKRLIAELASLADDLRRGYWFRVCGVATVVAGIVGIAVSMNEIPVLVTAFAAAAVCLFGATTMLKGITDELARVRMLLTIAPELTIEALGEIAEKASASL